MMFVSSWLSSQKQETDHVSAWESQLSSGMGDYMGIVGLGDFSMWSWCAVELVSTVIIIIQKVVDQDNNTSTDLTSRGNLLPPLYTGQYSSKINTRS